MTALRCEPVLGLVLFGAALAAGCSGSGGSGSTTTPFRPTPTPISTPTPTQSPTLAPGAVLLAPASLSFIATGTPKAMPDTAMQAGFSASFTASTTAAGQPSSCSGIATISAPSGSTFTVTPVAAGNCTFTIAGGNGQTAALLVSVTTTTAGGT